MKIILIAFGLSALILSSCGDAASGSTSEYGNEIDYSGYAKLRSVKFILNPKIISDSANRYLIFKNIIKADVQIDRQIFGIDMPIEYDGTDIVVSNDSLKSLSKPNYLIEISLLDELDSISFAYEYEDYINGNIENGEHVYIIRSVNATMLNGDTVNVRIDQVGTFPVDANERTKYLGVFAGEVK
jgi:hypothetical protein